MRANEASSDTLSRHLNNTHKPVEERSQMVPVAIVEEISSRQSLEPVTFSQSSDIGSQFQSEQQGHVAAQLQAPEVSQESTVFPSRNDFWTSADGLFDQPWWLEYDLNIETFGTSLYEPLGHDQPWFQPSNSRQNASQVAYIGNPP